MVEASLQRRRRHLKRGHRGLLLTILAFYAPSGPSAEREGLRDRQQEENVITMEYAY